MGRVVGAFIFVALTCAGCAKPAHTIVDRNDYVAEATRTYRGEPRERIIRAAEIVLKHSDPQDFEFRYNLGGFEGLRRYFIYAVFASANGRERWQFQTDIPEPGAVVASVSISEAGTVHGQTSTPYEGSMPSVPLYRLFWSRVDFVLGKNPNWVTCEEAAKELEATNTNVLALGGLCGPTSDGRNAPPPEVLPAPSRPIAAPTARQRKPTS